jgi:hypothetical protein
MCGLFLIFFCKILCWVFILLESSAGMIFAGNLLSGNCYLINLILQTISMAAKIVKTTSASDGGIPRKELKTIASTAAVESTQGFPHKLLYCYEI